MCGIFGALVPSQSSVDVGAVRRALKKIRHRGPDGEGVLLYSPGSSEAVNYATDESPRALAMPSIGEGVQPDAKVALGHRRLSIIDLTDDAHQPMSYHQDRYWMVFNGEVYNYVELRIELEKLGHVFRTGSDTEVVMAAYAEWGTSAFVKFTGMFALAILDTQDKTVVFARDPFGIKPLYYAVCKDTLYFSSEIKAFFEVPEMSRKCNPQSLYEYLRFGLTDHGSETFFDSIKQLPSAHFAVVRANAPTQVVPTRYWDINLGKPLDISFGEASARLKELLSESVRIHMRSDVPVGSCLSGGLDSTAIVSEMVKYLPAGELPTFTYVADDEVLSEAKYVDIAIRKYGVANHQTRPAVEEIAVGLPKLVPVLDEPFGGWSMYAQHRVFQLAKVNGIKVVLDGQGSDELLGGYVTMLGARASGLLCQGKLFKALDLLKYSPQNMSSYKRQMVLMSFGRLVPKALQPMMLKVVGASLYPDWSNKDYFVSRGVVSEQRPAGAGSDALREELKLSVQQISLPRLLRYEDRNSMHFSIESRVPFCNTRIADFALSLPPEYLISNKGETKNVLREAVRGFVPDEIIDREKVGFAVPERKMAASTKGWFEEQVELLREMNLPFLNTELLVKTLEHHINHSSQSELNQYWRPINVALWAKEFDVEF